MCLRLCMQDLGITRAGQAQRQSLLWAQPEDISDNEQSPKAEPAAGTSDKPVGGRPPRIPHVLEDFPVFTLSIPNATLPLRSRPIASDKLKTPDTYLEGLVRGMIQKLAPSVRDSLYDFWKNQDQDVPNGFNVASLCSGTDSPRLVMKATQEASYLVVLNKKYAPELCSWNPLPRRCTNRFILRPIHQPNQICSCILMLDGGIWTQTTSVSWTILEAQSWQSDRKSSTMHLSQVRVRA